MARRSENVGYVFCGFDKQVPQDILVGEIYSTGEIRVCPFRIVQGSVDDKRTNVIVKYGLRRFLTSQRDY